MNHTQRHRLLLVSTCGTSLLTNGASDEERKWFTEVSNDVEVDTDRLAKIERERRAALREADEPKRRRMSAEINGIHAALAHYAHQEVFHCLIHTDTALGKVAAELVQECLSGQAALLSAGGLRTNNLASFRVALSDLTSQLANLVDNYHKQGWFVVFNLTGGFKSLNGYLQTLAMVSADRCVFLFESASELMEIPRLPVRLAELEEVRAHAAIFRRLSMRYQVRADEARDVPESLLMEMDGQVVTSALGDVIWGKYRSDLFAEALYPPLSEKVQVQQAVHRAFNSLEAAQKVEVNEALDAFSAYLDHGHALLKSRTFKKLQGDPVPGSTHELYAWSTGGAGRLFGHYEGEKFVFDRLSNHL